MKRLALMLGRMTGKRRAIVQATLAAVITYYGALLGVQVADILRLRKSWIFVFHAVVSIALLALLALIVSTISDAVDLFVEKRRLVVATANTQLARCTIKETRRLLELAADQAHPGPLCRHDPLTAIRHVVEACYNTLEAHYGEAQVPGHRTAFEATFMTQDSDDGDITVAAWANRDGRMPDSLRARRTNRKVYERSVTADIYRSKVAERPVPRIIQDTSKEPYEELYPGQKDRIKSSIVYPIMSTSSDLLGTLVVHCDSVGFFTHADSKYWFEFLDIFACRIALEKLRLDLPPTQSGEAGIKTASPGT